MPLRPGGRNLTSEWSRRRRNSASRIQSYRTTTSSSGTGTRTAPGPRRCSWTRRAASASRTLARARTPRWNSSFRRYWSSHRVKPGDQTLKAALALPTSERLYGLETAPGRYQPYHGDVNSRRQRSALKSDISTRSLPPCVVLGLSIRRGASPFAGRRECGQALDFGGCRGPIRCFRIDLLLRPSDIGANSRWRLFVCHLFERSYPE